MKTCWTYQESERPAAADIVIKLDGALAQQAPRNHVTPKPLNDHALRYLPDDDLSNLRVIKDYKAETPKVRI